MSGIPLELVKYDSQSGKFSIGSEALKVLRQVKGPVGVVAVSGRARQGKSYILNQLLQATGGQGFTVGPTVRPCTKGLWMWSAPQRRVAADGSESHLVLLDTEGIDAYDQTAQYSTQIFSLAVLLSSLFVYNHMGGIDESALDRLSLVTEMTKHIRVRAGQGDDANLNEFTPSFLWLLRDFYLRLEEGGRQITARDYLETALMPVEGDGGSVKAKNEIRHSIKSLFPDRDCFSLVRPMNDETLLANLDQVPRDQLRPEFLKGVNELVRLISGKAQPKRFGTGLMNGPVLAGLVEAYVKAINEGAVPTIATAWQGVAESESRRAGDAAVAKYRSTFNQDTPADEKDLLAEHQRCLDLARVEFQGIAVGEEGIKKAHEAKYLSELSTFFKDISARKLAEAASKVNEMLYAANKSISAAIRSGGNLTAIQDNLGKFIEEYANRATGPTKWEKLADFLEDVYPAIANEAIARIEASHKSAVDKLKQELDQAHAHIKALQERAQKAEASAGASSASASALKQQLAAAQEAATKLQVDLDSATAKIHALETELKETAATAEFKVASSERDADLKIKLLQEQANTRITELQTALSGERIKATGLGGDVASLAAKLQAAESQVAALHQEITDWRHKYTASHEEKAQVSKELQEARSRITNVSGEREAINREKIMMAAQLSELKSQLQTTERDKSDMRAKLEVMKAEAERMMQEAKAAAGKIAAGRAAGGASRASADSDAPTDAFSKMSIQEIRDRLTTGGHEEAVWNLANRKPPPRKADWLDLARQCSGGVQE